jgi:hypothetical protein
MDTIVTVQYRIKHWEPERLKETIAVIDQREADPGTGLRADEVDGEAIMMYIHLGELDPQYDVISSSVEEAD